MNNIVLRIIGCGVLALASTYANASCYVVYDSQGKLIQQTAQPPVAMGGDLRSAVTAKFGPGSSMIFESQVAYACEDILTERAKRPVHQKTQNQKSQDVNSVLSDLARKHLEESGVVQWRTGHWLTDVKFK